MDIKNYVVGMLQTNCYVIGNDDRLLILDPGYAGDRLFAEIDSDGRKPEAILLTHGHFDHIMGVDAVVERYQIPVYALDKERDTFSDSSAALAGFFMEAEKHMDAEVTYFSEGDVLRLAGLEIETIWTPGHTPGGCCFYIPKEHVLFAGDSLFCGSVGRTDMPGGDMGALVRGLKEKIWKLPEETTVYPGHGPETTIGYEKQYNPFVR